MLAALPGLAAVGLLTAICFGLRLNFSATAFLYLIVVVVCSLSGGFPTAAVVSTAAVACLDYFFTYPIFSLTVSDPVDISALAAFLVTALAITRLAARAREQTRAALEQRRNLERLYRVSQQLLALDPEAANGVALLEPFRAVFDLRSVVLFDSTAMETLAAGDPPPAILSAVRNAYVAGADQDQEAAAIRCLRTRDKNIGAIGFEGLAASPVIAGSMAALAAGALERARGFRKAAKAAAQAESEAVRGAILDALAHEFKTPLATILTAAGGLREVGPLGAEQTELTGVIESQAERLAGLTSRLLRLARLDREEVRPRLEPVDLAELVSSLGDRFGPQFVFDAEPVNVLADPDLLRLAASQLLDNAMKYGDPSAPISVAVSRKGGAASLRVWNAGPPIPAEERLHVFDRFFRGAVWRRRTPGTGLGLYVARKIAAAHGGTVEAEDLPPGEGVAFRINVPIAEDSH